MSEEIVPGCRIWNDNQLGVFTRWQKEWQYKVCPGLHHLSGRMKFLGLDNLDWLDDRVNDLRVCRTVSMISMGSCATWARLRAGWCLLVSGQHRMCWHQVSGHSGQMDSQSPNIEQRAGPSFCSEEGRDTHCSRGGVLTNKRKQHNVTVETEEGEGGLVSIQWLKITGCRHRRVHCPSLDKTIGIIFSFSTLIPGVALLLTLHGCGHVSPCGWFD